MAKTDLETLVVRMEAQMRAFENELKRGRQTADRETRAIERRFADANKKISASFSGVGAALTRGLAFVGVGVGANELVKFADQFTKIQNALKVTGLEGAKLTAVYDQLFASAQKNAAPLQALATLYGRASLVQNELKVSTEELLQFTDRVALALRVSGQSAEQSSGALLQLSQALGSGVVRAEEFNSILEGALPIAQAAARGITEAGGSVAKLRGLINEGKVSSEAFFKGFQIGSSSLEQQAGTMQLTIGQAFTQFQNVLIDSIGKLDRTTGASQEVVKTLNELSEGVRNVASNIGQVTGPFRDLVGLLRQVDEAAQSAAQWIGRVTGANQIGPAVKSALGIQTAALRGITAPDLDLTGGQPGLKPAEPISIADFPVTGAKKAGSSTVGVDSFERAIANANKRIEVERAETAAINEGSAARERAKIVAELQAAAVAANTAAGLKNTEVTAAQNVQIQATADKMYAVAQASEAANGPMARYAREAMNVKDQLQEAAVSGLRGFEDALLSIADGSTTAAEAFKKMAQSIIQDLARIAIRAAITGPIAGAFGLPGFSLPGRAAGGPVSAGSPYVVGERGPELFVPKMPGQIVPNHAMRNASSTSVSISMNNDFRGVDPSMRAFLMMQTARMKEQAVREAIAAVAKQNRDRPGYLSR